MEHDPYRCCEKCLEYIPEGPHAGETYCLNVSCTCHTTQTTPSEEWASEYYDLCRELKYHDLVPRVRMKEFIEKTRTAAYEKGVQDSLEVVKEAEESYLIKSVHEDDPEILKASYNSRRYTIQVIKEAISTLLT